MIKHQNVPKEKCPVDYCDRTFDRYDKMRHHLVTTHGDGDEVICPVQECNMRIPFGLRERHMQNHRPPKFGPGSVVCKAGYRLDDKQMVCPIESCKHHKKKLRASMMQEHLRLHDKGELYAHREAVRTAGWTHDTIEIICPVCEAALSSVDQFEDHMKYEHICQGSPHIHWLRGLGRDFVTFWMRNRNNSYMINYWAENKGMPAPILDSLHSKTTSDILFGPYDEYAPHGLAILRFWPMFRFHPMFDCYLPKVHTR